MSESRSAVGAGAVKSFACLLCRQRKVRCDRRDPCANCVRADTACSFVPPVRGKRRRTKPAKEGLHAKVRRYEELLKTYGAAVEPLPAGRDGAGDGGVGEETNDDDDNDDDDDDDNDEDHNEAETPASKESFTVHDGALSSRIGPIHQGSIGPKLITSEGSSRYFDSGTWSAINDRVGYKFQHPDEYLSSLHTPRTQPSPADMDDIVLASLDEHRSGALAPLSSHFPPQHVLCKLMDIYADRVDPLMKILHMPVFSTTATDTLKNPSDVSDCIQALIFNVCFATINSLHENEVVEIFGMTKDAAFAKYKSLSRMALIEAGYLHTSSLTTLQAYCLYMTGIRSDQRQDTLYMLSGIAVRLARKMGLHRDGITLGLPPFETQMRRLLWWHIVQLDYRSADLASMRPSMDLFSSDTQKPLNIFDSDITVDMTKMPAERRGITPGILCLVRCELFDFFRELASNGSLDTGWDLLTSLDIPAATKDAMIDRIEDNFESKYLRYCDPTDSLHTFAAMMMRSFSYKARLNAHNPRTYATRDGKVSAAERDICLLNATKLLGNAAFARTNPSLQKYHWRISTCYLWDTIVFVLIEIRHRKSGPEVDRVWSLLEEVFLEYPEAFSSSNGAVYVALSKWTIEAWDDYVAAARANGQPDPAEPGYLVAMKEGQRAAAVESSAEAKRAPVTVPAPAPTKEAAITAAAAAAAAEPIKAPQTDFVNAGDFESMDGYNFADLMSFEMDPNEWMQWGQLTSEYGGPSQTYSM